MNATRRSSWALLTGILLGFLGAAWSGQSAAGYSKPDNFKRFHQRISPDASFYPPFAMLEQIALARWSPGKTLVIVGGNSIFNGVGQPAPVVWSLRLQEILGESYVVVNLAFRGAGPAQGGALVAEALLRRGLPVIYVANTYPLAGSSHAALGAYGYQYWQARAAHRLYDYPARDTYIDQWRHALPRAVQEAQSDQQLGSRLEPLLRQQSLWHHVGYRHLFTVWNPILGRDFWEPRARLPDNEPMAPPLASRFLVAFDQELATTRTFNDGFLLPGSPGHWAADPAVTQRLGAEIDAAFVPELRPHTLIVLNELAAFYLARLTPEEVARNRFAYQAAARLWRDHGIASEVVGDGFDASDYLDRVHLAPDGGLKLANIVARRITALNHP